MMEKNDLMVWDVEVIRSPDEIPGGWNDPEGMGLGTAVVWSQRKNQYFFFEEKDKDDLRNFLSGNRIVSFNGIKFDNRVLLGNEYQKSEHIFRDIDLLLEVVKSKFRLGSIKEAQAKMGDRSVHDGSINLDGLALGTLGFQKSGSGAHAPQLIQQGKWAEVFAYNLHDVRLTRMLYEFAKQWGYLIDRKGNQIRLEVE